MRIEDYIKEGVNTFDSFGKLRETKNNSIVFKNDRVASIIRHSETEYSVATCNYDGYFDWEVLKSLKGCKGGVVFCKNEEEVCKVLEFIKNL